MKGTLPVPEEDIHIIRDGGYGFRNQYKSAPSDLGNLTLIFPVTSSLVTNPAQPPLSRQFFTNLLFLYLQDTKALCSGHFLLILL